MTTSGRIDRIRSRCSRQEAQTMAEYAVILAVITPAIVAAYALFSGAIAPLIMQIVSFL
jgi:Flp pilus assembly pilin Flp